MHNFKREDHIVVGLGEVGTAIRSILNCDGFDFSDDALDPQEQQRVMQNTYRVLHICFPYTDKSRFKSEVGDHVRKYKPEIVVVHSTVPVGTCDPEGWVHSPVRGVHPNLEAGVKTFVKYFGGEKAPAIGHVFAQLGIKVKMTRHAKDTEALKLWDTTQYGILIELEKEIHDYCVAMGVDFDVVYRDGNETYNEGYRQLGKENVVRPVLEHMDGPIGGHCVVPNAKILKETTDGIMPLTEALLDMDRARQVLQESAPQE